MGQKPWCCQIQRTDAIRPILQVFSMFYVRGGLLTSSWAKPSLGKTLQLRQLTGYNLSGKLKKQEVKVQLNENTIFVFFRNLGRDSASRFVA